MGPVGARNRELGCDRLDTVSMARVAQELVSWAGELRYAKVPSSPFHLEVIPHYLEMSSDSAA